MTIEPTVSDAEVEVALPHLIAVPGSDVRPIGQFWPGETADQSEDSNWLYYGRKRVREALLAAARVRSAIPETEAVAWRVRWKWKDQPWRLIDDLALIEANRDHYEIVPLFAHPVLPDREGFKLVPVEPTPDMYGAGGVEMFKCDMAAVEPREATGRIYRAMIAASPATGEREPSRATDTAGNDDGWKHDTPFITTNSGPDGKKFVSVLVRTTDALHDAHDLVINAFKAAGAK
jgi:hypothetical protein